MYYDQLSLINCGPNVGGWPASEQDVADAIHYIAQVYALPSIRDDVRWFKEILDTLLDIAFPNGGVNDEAARFARRLITGIQEQLKE